MFAFLQPLHSSAETPQSRTSQPQSDADGSRDIEKGKPDWLRDAVKSDASSLSQVAPYRGPMAGRIRFEAIRAQHVRGIRDGPQMIPAARQCVTGPRFFPAPYAVLAEWVMPVIMILMDCYNGPRSIHNGLFHFQSFPNHPVVPKHAANRERRQIREQASRKNEIVDPIGRALIARQDGKTADLFLPIGICEIAGPRNFRIPAAADHEEFFVELENAFEGGAKILRENDVAIRIAEKVVARDGLRSREHVIHAIQTGRIFFRVRLMPNPQLIRRFSGALVVAEEDDFCVWMHQRPALQSVSLDNAAVPCKWLGGGEKSKHVCLLRISLRQTPPSNEDSGDRRQLSTASPDGRDPAARPAFAETLRRARGEARQNSRRMIRRLAMQDRASPSR